MSVASQRLNPPPPGFAISIPAACSPTITLPRYCPVATLVRQFAAHGQAIIMLFLGLGQKMLSVFPGNPVRSSIRKNVMRVTFPPDSIITLLSFLRSAELAVLIESYVLLILVGAVALN